MASEAPHFLRGLFPRGVAFHNLPGRDANWSQGLIGQKTVSGGMRVDGGPASPRALPGVIVELSGQRPLGRAAVTSRGEATGHPDGLMQSPRDRCRLRDFA